MFLKLLKHDMKSVFRLWWFMIPITSALVLVDAIAIRIVTQSFFNISTRPQISDDEAVIMTFVLLIAYFVFWGVTVLLSMTIYYTLVLTAYRFFKNLFTDEGYLTFTLPVKRSEVLRSKMVNAMIWLTLHGAILIVGAIFIIIVAFPTTENEFLFGLTAFKEVVAEMWSLSSITISPIWAVVIIIEYIIYALISTFSSVALLFLCLTLGALIVKKFKLAAGIGIFVLVQWIVPFALGVAFYFLYFMFAMIISFVATAVGPFAMGFIIAIIIAMLCVVSLLEAHVLYFINRNCLERRLNLA